LILNRRIVAEFSGTAMLLVAVVGSLCGALRLRPLREMPSNNEFGSREVANSERKTARVGQYPVTLV
jgi:hypothetical protein